MFLYITGEKSTTSKTEFIADFSNTPLILLRRCNVTFQIRTCEVLMNQAQLNQNMPNHYFFVCCK